MQPLTGITVLDFSTLLPGPLATLVLAEAGARVIKVERPGPGDGQRQLGTPYGETTAQFAQLNRGKRSVAIDLKSANAFERLKPLIETADVLVEQFRPGVMDRLGLGYDRLKALNPKLIYCSLTGYGQRGPKAMEAGHDLNYLAETGLLMLSADKDGTPVLPPALLADIGGGAYPVVINVLLALRQRERDGGGCALDIAMSDNVFPLASWALGHLEVTGCAPVPGGEMFTGGSPRYQIYRTSDRRYLAAAPLEQKFWDNFCDVIGLDEKARDDDADPVATKRAVAEIIAGRSAADWIAAFDGVDACVCIATDLKSAVGDPHFSDRGLFAHRVGSADSNLVAATVPVAPQFRASPGLVPFPPLGEANEEFFDEASTES
ncbi:MAG: CaiB/BaiF CoA-transferase family protein [Gammaproteobacteria bacterium]|nr:CaiB/BaiF CoA-transferase family protein [Gammaproteobacteria bacterium]